MAKLGGLVTEATDENVVITAPTLNATKYTSIGALAVAVATPVLTFITNQEAAVREAALTIAVVALPSVAVVVAADILARAYVQAKAPAAPGAPADAAAVKPAGSAAISMAGDPVRVRVTKKGQDPFRLIAMRHDPATAGWQFLVARKDQMSWVAESEVDEYISG